MIRLGVNVDHVATLRNAREGAHPSVVAAARVACAHGADGITVHLREDRRHIRDEDVAALMLTDMRLNLEMAATEEMASIAERFRPAAVCLVPERREEQTTEGGLDVHAQQENLQRVVSRLKSAGIVVSLFIEADEKQVAAASAVGAQAVEFHTGGYALTPAPRTEACATIARAARQAHAQGLICHAGHGLDFDNVGPIAALETIVELNIGYFLIGQALFDSLGQAVAKMKALMEKARQT